MILVTVLCVCVLDVHADDPLFIYDNPQTGYSVYINDAYDLLTEEEEANLLDDMIPITEYGNAGFVSCSNTETSTVQYSKNLYERLFGTDSGMLLVIDMGNRELYIKNNGKISEVVTNAYSLTISDNIHNGIKCFAESRALCGENLFTADEGKNCNIFTLVVFVGIFDKSVNRVQLVKFFVRHFINGFGNL